MFVRLGMEEDIEDVVEMARLNVEETRSEHGFSADRVREVYNRYIENGNPVVYIAEHQRKAVGFLLASVCRFQFADGHFGVQEVLFVRPEFRGTRAAVLLMKHLIAEAERQGLKELVGGNDNGFNSDRTRKFLEHFGFETVGYSMRRMLHGRQERQQ
jgi:L-amino acid N-acyltransferase YncA